MTTELLTTADHVSTLLTRARAKMFLVYVTWKHPATTHPLVWEYSDVAAVGSLTHFSDFTSPAAAVVADWE